jgi:hypothetical protein
MAGDILADARTGKNGRHALVSLLRQSVPRRFFRNAPNRLLERYFAARNVLDLPGTPEILARRAGFSPRGHGALFLLAQAQERAPQARQCGDPIVEEYVGILAHLEPCLFV